MALHQTVGRRRPPAGERQRVRRISPRSAATTQDEADDPSGKACQNSGRHQWPPRTGFVWRRPKLKLPGKLVKRPKCTGHGHPVTVDAKTRDGAAVVDGEETIFLLFQEEKIWLVEIRNYSHQTEAADRHGYIPVGGIAPEDGLNFEWRKSVPGAVGGIDFEFLADTTCDIDLVGVCGRGTKVEASAWLAWTGGSFWKKERRHRETYGEAWPGQCAIDNHVTALVPSFRYGDRQPIKPLQRTGLPQGNRIESSGQFGGNPAAERQSVDMERPCNSYY